MRMMLKSKIHKATVTRSDPSYEGSIGIDKFLMEKADILPEEKVLVISIDSGERLETYAFPENKNSGDISIYGGAANKIHEGEKITILSFKLTDEEFESNKILVNEKNEIENLI